MIARTERTSASRRSARLLVSLLVLALVGLGAAAPAVAVWGDGFGPAKVNDGAGPFQDVPAFPDGDDPNTAENEPDDAFWAGACDRLAAPPPGSGVDMGPAGGVGTIPSTLLVPNGPDNPRAVIAAPAQPRHCIDWGAHQRPGTDPWLEVPTWRLPPEVRAGAHPDGTASMVVTRPVDGDIDNIVVDLPPGFVGNPQAVPACPSDVFMRVPTRCPPETQVGVINLHIVGAPFAFNQAGDSDDSIYPVWNVEPRQGRVAELGFSYASGDRATTVRLTAKPRSGSDNGVTAFVGQIPVALAVLSQQITLWGIPWAAENDIWRWPSDIPGEGWGVFAAHCTPPGDPNAALLPYAGLNSTCRQSYDPSWGPVKPFLTNETDCNREPLTVQRMDAFQKPGTYTAWGEPNHDDPNWKTSGSQSPPVAACETLSFAPDVTINPTNGAADGASGLDFSLSIPQNENPRDAGGALLPVPNQDATPTEVDDYVQAATDYWRSDAGRATAHLKDTVVTLPAGFTVNPSGATGLQACPDAVIGVRQHGDPPLFHTNDPTDGLAGDDCPNGSKIGTVKVETPLLEEDLTGDVVLGEPKSTDPQSGEMFRMFLIVRDKARGLLLKVYGSAVADPMTGQITATFRNNPELPFSNLDVDIKGGQRGLLGTPQTCGGPTWSTALTPWSASGASTPVPNATDGGAFGIDARCANAFAPGLDAGMSTSQARAQGGTFSFRLTRPEGEQYLSGLTAKLPQGLLASVRGVPLCKNAEAAAGACPAASRIGIADAAAGSGDPFVLEEKGQVFLTEGYKGGEYGLMVKVRGVAGPFRGASELSPIIVRQAIHVDRRTAQVTAISDPLPTIHHGVPLRVRQITVLVDRGGFMVNPSDCSRSSIDAALTSVQGAHASAGSPFQAGNCMALPFKPRLALTLTGRKQVTTGRHPGIKAVVRQTGVGEAGIEKAVVRLPKSLALDPANAQALCEFEDGTSANPEDRCPKGSIVGRARAVSPLLNDPLVGNVYFVKNVRRSSTGNLIRTLPMLIVALRGEIAVNLKGESDTTKSGKLVNKFASVPDAPITRFNMNVKGGKSGILAVTRTNKARVNLCRKPRSHIAETEMDGQNGKRRDFDVRMKTPCAKPAPKSKRRGGR